MKKLVSVILLLVLAFSLSIGAFAAAPVIKETEYEGAGRVEVDFTTRVQYKNLKVTVKGPDGVSKTAKVVDKDNDDLTFVIPNAKPGQKYSFKISGIRAGKTGDYKSVSGTVKVPNWDPLMKEVEYDRHDKELEIDFVKRVEYKNLKVKVTDASGKSYTCKIDEKNSRELELVVKGLKAGKTYTVTISGVRPISGGSYQTISGSFRVK